MTGRRRKGGRLEAKEPGIIEKLVLPLLSSNVKCRAQSWLVHNTCK
jgi:hypothetical protein